MWLITVVKSSHFVINFIDEFRTHATSNIELHMTVVGSFQQSTIVTKSFILDAAVSLDPPLIKVNDNTRAKLLFQRLIFFGHMYEKYKQKHFSIVVKYSMSS